MSFLDEIRKESIDTIEDSIYFDKIIGENIIKSVNNKYVKLYKIEDINYRLSDSEGKESILLNYMNLFNNLDKDIGISIILSRRENIDEFYVEEKDDNLLNLRSAINETIKENIYKNGKCNIIKKYIALDIEDKSDDSAIKRFEVIDDIIKGDFYEIGGCYLKEEKVDNLIKILYLYYNPDKREVYKRNKGLFATDNLKSLNLSIKEVIRPSSMEIKIKHIKFNETYERCLYLRRTNKTLQATCLNQIINDTRSLLNETTDTTICIKIRQIDRDIAIKMAKRELGNVEGDIYNVQTKFSKRSISSDLVPRSYKQRREEALYISDSLMKRDENLFNVSIYCAIRSDSLNELSNNSYKFIKKAKSYGLTFITGTEMQEHIYNSIMPYGVNQTPYSLIFDTESLRAFNIFNAMDVIETDGDYYGKNKLTNNIIKYNIMHGDNYSQLILGMSGKGKSFIGKLQLITRRLRNELREGVILDPQNEWRDVVTELGGKIIDVKAAGNININLFDIDESYGDNPLAEKEEFILSVCALMLRKELTAGQRTTISIAVNNIYKKWDENKVEDNVPTLEDFANELKKIIFSKKQYSTGELSEPNINYLLDTNFVNGSFVNNEDIELLKAIMYYSETSNCKIFRGKSQIKINNPLICFNLKDLGNDLKPLAMEVICDLIWLRICKTKERRVPTDVIIDEFHLMFKDKSTASWMARYWKMLRKHLGCPIGITQNPEDVLSTDDGRNVINNTSFSILLSLLERDRELVKDIWKLTDEEIKYISDRKRGEGIYVFGASKTIKKQTVVPFENEFKKSNYIYRIINTSYDAE
ncbi:MAG: hypothetical protein IJP71_02240 [Lachnospiraceae bacterium]|nr:hypothetical protein [Lachnospiraceae bacterium]